MRFIPVLLISVALATASGCFGKDDENGDGTTTTPTGTGTMTPTGPGGTTPTSGATPTSPTTGGNTTTPSKPAPRELCPVSKDFAGQTPTPPATSVTTTGDCGAVTAGYTKIVINGNFTANTPIPASVGNGIAVRVLDAAGTAVLTCQGPPPGPMQAPVPCTQEGSALAGAYTLAFDGTGAVTFTGSVTIS